MELNKIRSESLRMAQKLGYEVNPSLPLLDEGITLRPKKEIVARSLALFAVVSCSYGFDRKESYRWVERENLNDYLTESEKKYLLFGEGETQFYQLQVESLNAFAWLLGFVQDLRFDSVCDNSLIRVFPDLKVGESCTEYISKSKLRLLHHVSSACDLAYCLHWSIRDARLNHMSLPDTVKSYVIIERRRTLDWVLSRLCWDEITLDT